MAKRAIITSVVEEKQVGEDGNLSSSYEALFERERRRPRGRREGGGLCGWLGGSRLFSLRRLFGRGQFLFLLLLLFDLLPLLPLLQSYKNGHTKQT